jgi:hypothetical protein
MTRRALQRPVDAVDRLLGGDRLEDLAHNAHLRRVGGPVGVSPGGRGDVAGIEHDVEAVAAAPNQTAVGFHRHSAPAERPRA